jgi:hypothetical protein
VRLPSFLAGPGAPRLNRVDPLVASEGFRWPEPLLPDIGQPATSGRPDGQLHAYLLGSGQTLCGWPLGLLQLWPSAAWPGIGDLDDRCTECLRATFPGVTWIGGRVQRRHGPSLAFEREGGAFVRLPCRPVPPDQGPSSAASYSRSAWP